jgi:hypothetical protein
MNGELGPVQLRSGSNSDDPHSTAEERKKGANIEPRRRKNSRDGGPQHTLTRRARHCWQPARDFLWCTRGAYFRGASSSPGCHPTNVVATDSAGTEDSGAVSDMLQSASEVERGRKETKQA